MDVTAAMEALMEVCQVGGQVSVITDIMIWLMCNAITDHIF
jgi:hypothetical protein